MTDKRSALQDILRPADVEIGGDRPFDIRVSDSRLYDRLLAGGALALGESYMDGWWSCDDLDEMTFRLLGADLESRIVPLRVAAMAAAARLKNMQSRRRAVKNVTRHYDLGNALFTNMLDPTMSYSCGYWADATTLDEAQIAKLDLICRKLHLEPGMRLLDIGCGWGGLMRHAATQYGAVCTGVTLSSEQLALGRELSKGLPVELRLQDYREVSETFDRVVSVGMFEHVGTKNYRRFMEVAERSLRPDGLFLLHTIGANGRRHVVTDPWTEKYIFPGGNLPIAREIVDAAAEKFRLEDWHNFGLDYARTTRAWFERFDRNWELIRAEGYDERFYRMWKYFLLTAAGAFRARRNELWQIVFSRGGFPSGYRSIR